MCWIALALGVTMLFIGTFLVTRAMSTRRAQRGDLADATHAEGLLLGALLMAIGFLLTVFGGTGSLCQYLGIAW